MAQVNIYDKKNENNSRIGAIICHTPKTLNNTIVNGKSVDNRCVLIENTNQLVEYFGNPYIDPTNYSDLIIAYNMVSRGIKVYISSLYDMKDNPEDGFNIQYNGYTEFRFKDKDNRNKAGYKLKSDIKFCQPIIQSEVILDKLNLYISLYIIDRHREKRLEELNSLEVSQLFTTIRIAFDLDAKDKDIIEALKPYGLELQIINTSAEDGLIKCFIDRKKLSIVQDGNKAIALDNNLGYTYNLHNDKYDYNLSDTQDVLDEYTKSILSLASKKPYPHYVCLSKLYKSKTTKVNIENSDHITRSVLTDLDPDFYPIIQSTLLENFSDDSDTYLIISAPDISVSSLISLLDSSRDYSFSFALPDQFNCDLIYGYAADYINSSLQSRKPFRVFYSAALLSFYNSLYNDTDYMPNSVDGLNISNKMVRSSIEEYSANTLAELRCNSLVLFDTGFPSIHGNRTQSTLPNLRHSHIARNMVRIRRLIREYLETKKFILSTVYNINSCINYIRTDILDKFKEAGILKDYIINYNSVGSTTNINISLDYSASAESIKLEFTI